MPVTALPEFADDAERIPIDDDVRIGTLDNGLTYYIRENNRPGGRAQLRLAVKAGSVLEDADQPGAAHFVEHMMFNGTEAFPKNELVRVLQRFGAEFGPEINAFTSYDETVYELELPTDEPGIIATGLDVLSEWASRATIAQDDVDAERGVLIEEWRLRSQGTSGRYFEGVTARLLGGTPYEDRGPLAGPGGVNSITRDALARYYDEWYRPGLMAIIAVGDFDADEVMELIEEGFADSPDRSTGREPAVPTIEVAADPTFFVLADAETVGGVVELNYPLHSVPQGTVGAVRQELALGIAFEAIVTRLREDALRGDAAYFDASFAANPLVNAQRSPGTGAFAEVDNLGATARALLTETERALQHGFTDNEVGRVVGGVRRAVELTYEGRATTQDIEFAEEYLEHFLTGKPIPSAKGERDLLIKLLDEVTMEQVEATFRATVGTTEPLVIIVAPEEAAASLPSEDDLAVLLRDVVAADIPLRADVGTGREVLMERPDPAAISAEIPPGPFGEIVLEMENGATVILRKTDIARDMVFFTALSFGGWSLLPLEDVAEAQLVQSIVTGSGLGLFDQVELEQFVEDKAAGVGPFIGETEEGFFGQAGTDDLEVMFQLLHLYMTSPRADDIAFDRLVDQVRPLAASPDTIPDLALFNTLADARFGGDQRYRPFPPVSEIDTFDLERALEVYRERFADAGDFVFVFAGDFNLGGMRDLARSYIGTLPGRGEPETFADVQPDPPAGIVERVVSAGSGELAGTIHLWTTRTGLDPVTRIHVRLLELVLQQRLTEVIREGLSATYSPQATIDVSDEPDQTIEVLLQVSGAPDRLDEVVDAVLDVAADFRTNGPTADELAIAQVQLVRNLELVSNQNVIDTLLFYALHPHEDPEDEFNRLNRIQDTTVADLAALTTEVMPGDRYIEVRLLPQGFREDE